MTINQIKDLSFNIQNVMFTNHVINRCRQRKIELVDIIEALKHGVLVEDYIEDYPYPSILLLHHIINDKPLHVVAGIGNNKVHVITAYYPTTKTWENDFKTRKKVGL